MEGNSDVVVLENGSVVVSEGEFIFCVYHEWVVKSRMVCVVHESRDE